MPISSDSIPVDSFWPWALDVLADFGRRWAELKRQQATSPAVDAVPSPSAKSLSLTSTFAGTAPTLSDQHEVSGNAIAVRQDQTLLSGQAVETGLSQ